MPSAGQPSKRWTCPAVRQRSRASSASSGESSWALLSSAGGTLYTESSPHASRSSLICSARRQQAPAPPSPPRLHLHEDGLVVVVVLDVHRDELGVARELVDELLAADKVSLERPLVLWKTDIGDPDAHLRTARACWEFGLAAWMTGRTHVLYFPRFYQPRIGRLAHFCWDAKLTEQSLEEPLCGPLLTPVRCFSWPSKRQG